MMVRLGSLETVFRMLAEREAETVGLILGVRRSDVIECKTLYRVDNLLSSRTLFEADPWQVVQAHIAAEAYGLEVVGLFHTHPSCPATPSERDVEGMRGWRIPWIIACRSEVRAWLLDGESIVEIPIER